jgi:hypothetical protein
MMPNGITGLERVKDLETFYMLLNLMKVDKGWSFA